MVAAKYLCFCKEKYTNIDDALNEVCIKLKMNPEKSLFPSQNHYLNYIGKILTGTIVI